jgi:hypothetical protein
MVKPLLRSVINACMNWLEALPNGDCLMRLAARVFWRLRIDCTLRSVCDSMAMAMAGTKGTGTDFMQMPYALYRKFGAPP